MAGRGRGRGGNTLSLTHEQLQSLGIGRGENTQKVVPPPLFPKLETKPLPLTCDAATDYMLIVKDQFIEFLHETAAYVKPKIQSDGVERYSDQYKILAQDAKQCKVLDCVWANMPIELRPHVNRTRATTRKRKLDDPTEIIHLNKRLKTLENKEVQENGETTEKHDNTETVKKQADNDDDDEEVEDEQEEQFELDDGTDYGNNYFDNGEEFDDEDDNLDDGPVY